MDESRILIIGSNGQLGTELKKYYKRAIVTDIKELDISNTNSLNNYSLNNVDIIINAAAYTDVDGAETEQGRIKAWEINAVAVANLSKISNEYNITLVHISSDYVFDGNNEVHKENERFSPLSVYGSSKAAGDIAVINTNKYYLVRSSWVIGEGKNFVKTMIDIGEKGINPTVVSDQIGRLTFTSEIVHAINHLLINKTEFGTYNLTNDGESTSWSEITREIFKICKFSNEVIDITTEDYFQGKVNIASRPLFSNLDLSKIHNTGFISVDWKDDLVNYINKEIAK